GPNGSQSQIQPGKFATARFRQRGFGLAAGDAEFNSLRPINLRADVRTSPLSVGSKGRRRTLHASLDEDDLLKIGVGLVSKSVSNWGVLDVFLWVENADLGDSIVARFKNHFKARTLPYSK